MSRYLMLVLVNAPLIVLSIISAIVAYKLKRISFKRLFIRISFWLIVLVGLIFTQQIYRFLFSNHLTETEPLSLFDVVQITGIISALYLTNRAYSKVDTLERQVRELHQELSIRLSEKSK